MPIGYCVWVVEHLRDGKETSSCMFRTLDEAMQWINKLSSGWSGEACTFELFEVGRQIHLELQRNVQMVKPAETTTVNKYVVKEGR